MRFFKHALRSRVKSLEDYIGVTFTDEEGYPDHDEKRHSTLARTRDRIDRIERKVFTEKERKDSSYNNYYD